MVSGAQVRPAASAVPRVRPAVSALPQLSDQGTALVPLESLQPSDSPRLDGVDEAHVRLLMDSGTELPPILVHRQSMRIIDGMHRLHAARCLGRSHIAVEYFDGDNDAAFVRSVTANTTHGLPLSLADRKAAAVRITTCYPSWSDRRVGRAAGLSGKTVAVLRQRAADDTQPRRIGQDGRVRPVDGASGRQLAGDILAAQPEASLRQVARAAGIAPATVRDVRERLRRGDSPMTATQLRALPANDDHQPRRASRQVHRDIDIFDTQSTLEGLRKDPSLRYTDSGRALLRWLDRYLVDDELTTRIISTAPPHCLPILARLARHCVEEWTELAERLDRPQRSVG